MIFFFFFFWLLTFTRSYHDVDPEEAVADFIERRRIYGKYYQPLEDSEGSYIKMIDCKKFVVNGVRGYLPLKVRTTVCLFVG